MRFVPVNVLQPGMVLARDIISSTQANMLRRGVTLNAEYVAYLQSNGYMGAYILDSMSEDIIIEETIQQELFCEGVDAVKESNIGNMVKVATDIVGEIAVKKEQNVDLYDLRSYDDYTFHHSVNVAVYSVIIGKKMGLSDKELQLICQAGLMHDIGKSKISLDVLNKNGRLTDEEYAVIKMHPRYAFDMLSTSGGISAKVKQAVLMHHENENGSGYPLGKGGQEIPLFAKIIHAADVYDALTSKRPYKNPYAPVDAFEYLKGGIGILFDEKVVKALMQTVPAYPPGISVYLSNGEEAIVMAHTKDALKPKIRLMKNGRTVDLSADSEYKDVYISRSGIMPQDYVGDITSLNEDRQAVRTKKQQIMIVDSQKLLRMQTMEAIGDEYDYICMNSGLEAINYLSANKQPDLIIMDIELPIMDGITAAKNIRARGIKDVPIMFLSSSGSIETVAACRGVGAVDYILKPAKPIYIRERAEIALKNQRE